MRINGWQRIGIVASVVWFFVGGWKGSEEVLKFAGEIQGTMLQGCSEMSDRLKEQVCAAEASKKFMSLSEHRWGSALFYGLIPIPFIWLIGWGLIALYRWIRVGFKREQISN